MYSLAQFGGMIADRNRMTAFRDALKKAVFPGCVVLDLGAGTGIMAMLALQLGARRAIAIEPSDAIQLGRETAKKNELAERIEFIQNISSKVDLAEKVDVIVEDMRGTLPWHGTHIPDVIDARERFLKPGGTLIAMRDTSYCAVVEAEESFDHYTKIWSEGFHGLDLSPALRYATNAAGAIHGSSRLLTSGAAWSEIDYGSVSSPHSSGDVELRVDRDGIGNGILLWFESQLAPGVTLSSSPDQPDTVYGRRFFPWPQRVALRAGDCVRISLRADLVRKDYVWTWTSQICGPDRKNLQFRQSTFAGAPVSADSLRRRAGSHEPKLNRDGKLVRSILDSMDRGTPLIEIAHQVSRLQPDRFADAAQALDYVAGLAADLCE